MISRPRISSIDEATLKAPARRIRPDRADIERAAAADRQRQAAALLTGGGIHLSEAWDALTRFAEAQSIPVAHTMSGKGGIACTNPLSVGLFGRYSRIANDLIEASDCLIVVGCKLGEIATKRFALPPAANPGHPSRHRRRGDRPLHPGRDRAVGRCARRARRPGRCAVGQRRGTPAPRGPTMSPRSRRACRRWEDDAAPRLNSRDRPVHMARLCRELNRDPAGGRDPRRRWRVRRALDRAALRHEKRRTAFHPGSRLRLDRLWAAGRDRAPRSPRPTARSSRSAAMAAST